MKQALLLVLVLLICLVLQATAHSNRNVFSPSGVIALDQRDFHLLDFTQSWYYGNDWHLSNKSIMHYNAQFAAQLDSIALITWDTDSNSWEQYGAETYSYDNWGRITSSSYFSTWDNVIILEGRGVYFYDAQHRLTQALWYNCNANREEILEERNHVYYSGNHISQMISYSYDYFNDEASYYRATYSSDNQGRITESVEAESSDSLSWVNSWRSLYSYDSADTSTGQTLCEYLASSYAQNVDTVNLLYLPCMWSSVTGQEWTEGAWVNTDRSTYTWQHPLNRLDMSIQETWQDGAWANYHQNTLTYNVDGNCAWDLEWEWTDTSWQEWSRTQFTWGSFVGNDDQVIPSPQTLNLKAWPMPFSSGINIRPETAKTGEVELKIYNLKGELLNKFQCRPGSQIWWDGRDRQGANCASGIYFLSAKQGNEQQQIRIVKLK